MIATVEPIGRDEFVAAGQKGMKARYKFNVWANEYNDEQEVEYNGRRLTIYRSYGPKDDGKSNCTPEKGRAMYESKDRH